MAKKAVLKRKKTQSFTHYVVVYDTCKIQLILPRKSKHTKYCGLCSSESVTKSVWKPDGSV